MKRKPFILVAFMLCLYLVPTFVSAASWHEVTSAELEFDTPDWNEITSAELGFVTPEPPSDQSITSFAETLPDDVLYYPDSFTNTTQALATSGDDDYIDSLAVDAVTWLVSVGTSETINYDYNTGFILDGFTYHHYGYYTSTPNPAWCALEYYNSFTDTWDNVMNFTRDTPVNPHWTNDTFYFPNKFTPLALGLRVIASSSDSSTGSTDYLGIEMIYLTTYSNDSYAESFSEGSDWDLTGLEGGDTFTTDDDVSTIDTDSTAGSDYLWTNVPSLSAESHYVEIRYKCTGSATYARVYYWTGADKGGSSAFDVLTHSTTWVTLKFYIDVVVECVEIVIYKAGATDYDIALDYLRIDPGNEMGWQHDGSTTETITNDADSGITYTSTSDEDILTLTAENTDGSSQIPEFYIAYDSTTTASDLETSDYPFFEASINATVEGGATYVNIGTYVDGYYGLEALNIDGTFTTIRRNVFAQTASSSGKYIRFYSSLDQIGEKFTLEINYTKYYSVANYTVTQGASTTTSDILFIDDGALNVICPTVANHYFELNYDPTMDVNTSIFELFTITATVNTQWFAEYVGSWQSWKVDMLTGVLESGTMTDFKLLVDGSTIISRIDFHEPLSLWWEAALAELIFRVKDWADVVIAVLVFLVELYTFEWFFILAGLVMIPTSTLFLVRGGKDDMSRDKLFLFFLIFLFGWAFILGGLL